MGSSAFMRLRSSNFRRVTAGSVLLPLVLALASCRVGTGAVDGLLGTETGKVASDPTPTPTASPTDSGGGIDFTTKRVIKIIAAGVGTAADVAAVPLQLGAPLSL